MMSRFMTEHEFRLRRLLHAVVEKLSSIDQNIQAIRKSQQAADNAENARLSPLRVEIPQAPQLDPARRDYYESENRERQSRLRKTKPWVETIGVFVAIALGMFNLLTLIEIH